MKEVQRRKQSTEDFESDIKYAQGCRVGKQWQIGKHSAVVYRDDNDDGDVGGLGI